MIRAWEIPAEISLNAGPGVLPLSVIADDAQDRIEDIIGRSSQRAELLAGTRDEERELLAAEFVLLGLRYPVEFAEKLFAEVSRMEESTTYQAILAKGRTRGRIEGREEGREEGLVQGEAEGLRLGILKIGTRRFGPPSPEMSKRLEDVTELASLEKLLDRALDANGWDDLLPL